MPVLQDLLSWADNKRRVMGRNLSDLVSDPMGTAEQIDDRAANYNANVQPVAQGGQLYNRPLTEEEKQQRAIETALNVGPMGVGMIVGPKAANWASVPNKFKDVLTGQEKGVISDAGASFNEGALRQNPYNQDLYSAAQFGSTAKLGDILNHEELYKAYPWVADMKVKNTPLGSSMAGVQGAYGGGSVYLSGGKQRDVMGTLLHEIQHIVQKGEKFVRGGSPEDFMANKLAVDSGLKSARSAEASFEEKLKSISPEFSKYSSKVPESVKSSPEYNAYLDVVSKRKELESIADAAYVKYKSLGGEAEARATTNMWHNENKAAFVGPERRFDFSAPSRQGIPGPAIQSRNPYDFYDVPIDSLIAHPKQPILRRPMNDLMNVRTD